VKVIIAYAVCHTRHVKSPSSVVHDFRGDEGGIFALNSIVESLACQPDLALHLRASAGSPRELRVDWGRTDGRSTG